MPEYSQEQLRELYSALPEKLQGALYSEQNGKNIKEICEKNNITSNETIWEINKYVGYVLFGLLPPNELSETLEENLKIEENTAKKISSQLTRFVFMPIKDILEPLYGIEIKFDAKEKKETPKSEKNASVPAPIIKDETPDAEKNSSGEDGYRELIQ